jgi:hypothetical protein
VTLVLDEGIAMTKLPGYEQWAIVLGVGLLIWLLLRLFKPPLPPPPPELAPDGWPLDSRIKAFLRPFPYTHWMGTIGMPDHDGFAGKYWQCACLNHQTAAEAHACAYRYRAAHRWDGRRLGA